MIFVKIKKTDPSYGAENARKCAEIIKLICKKEASICAYADAILQKKNSRSVASSLCALECLLEMCAEHGIAPSSISINKEKLGRPYFSSHPTLDFNISHTDTYVAVALATAQGERVGIDVEDVSRYKEKPDTPQNLAKRFFLENELLEFEQGGASNDSFAQLWTRKEAYLKYTGDGLGKMSSTDTFSDIPNDVSFISDSVGLISSGTYFTLCYSPSESEPHIEILA